MCFARERIFLLPVYKVLPQERNALKSQENSVCVEVKKAHQFHNQYASESVCKQQRLFSYIAVIEIAVTFIFSLALI